MKEEYIAHYGIKRRSGRYPWGSGERGYQREDRLYRKQVRKNIRTYPKREVNYNPKKILDLATQTSFYKRGLKYDIDAILNSKLGDETIADYPLREISEIYGEKELQKTLRSVEFYADGLIWNKNLNDFIDFLNPDRPNGYIPTNQERYIYQRQRSMMRRMRR